MAKTKVQKKQVVADFKDKVAKSKALVFANFEGLGVSELEELRRKAREQNAEVFVAKKTLMKLAFEDSDFEVDPKTFDKGVLTIFGYGDEITPSKVSAEFAKDHEALNIIGGIFESNFIDASKVAELSKILSRPELLAKLVGTLQAPISGMVNVLQGNIRALVNVLNSVKDSK